MTSRLGVFGLPASDGLILVRASAEPIRLSRRAFDVPRTRKADDEPKLRKMLRTLIAIHADGGKKK